ncbi:MAG: FtsH protease activity modulator HflK [Nitrospinota bacterium]|nr:FtsH protease activity modulator HflK [Nitrospinota bacterium]
MGWEDKWRPPGGQQPPINIPDIKLPDLPPLNKSTIISALMIAFGIWVLTGIYKVELNERGIVLLFGKYMKVSEPGLNWFVPSPIGDVIKVRVEEIKRVEIGFRSSTRERQPNPNAFLEESLMLTKSVNIVDIDMVVQYQVSDPINYLFKVADDDSRELYDRGLEGTVRSVAESALRESVGRTEIDMLLTTDKGRVQEEVRQLIQKILDKYESGIHVGLVQFQDIHPPQEVREAFKDVNNAEEDKNRLIREAEGYLNSIIPVTRGKVEQILKEAEAYREQKEKRAEGDASRFTQQLEEYRKGKDVTRKRLYLETVEAVLENSKKILVDKQTAEKMMPILSFGQDQALMPPGSAGAPTGAGGVK